MKIYILIGAVLFFSCFNGTVGHAEKNQTSVVYSLSENQKQVSTLVTEDGEEITVTIEKESSFFRALGNGTYSVSTERTGSWKASYQVVVKNNSITATKNASATYYLKRKVGTSTSNINVRAKIEDSRLIVYVLT